jgi:hypothetical protein
LICARIGPIIPPAHKILHLLPCGQAPHSRGRPENEFEIIEECRVKPRSEFGEFKGISRGDAEARRRRTRKRWRAGADSKRQCWVWHIGSRGLNRIHPETRRGTQYNAQIEQSGVPGDRVNGGP